MRLARFRQLPLMKPGAGPRATESGRNGMTRVAILGPQSVLALLAILRDSRQGRLPACTLARRLPSLSPYMGRPRDRPRLGTRDTTSVALSIGLLANR